MTIRCISPRLWEVVVVTTIVVLSAVCQSYSQTTPNIHLNLPSYNNPNWNVPVNSNFSMLDYFLSGNSTIPGLSISGPLTLGTLSNGCLTVTAGLVSSTGSSCGSGGGGGGGVTSINGSTGAFTFNGAGVSCSGTTCAFTGGGSSTTFQVNGTGLSSSSTINFENSSVLNGLTVTFSNPSAGNVQLGLSGTLGNAGLTNSGVTIGASAPLGGGGAVSLGSSLTLTCTSCVLASSPGAGIAHFAGSTQTVTSSAVNLAGSDVTGLLPATNIGTLSAGSNGLANSATTDTTNASNITSGTLNVSRIPTAIPIASVGSAGLSGSSPITVSVTGAIGCPTCATGGNGLSGMTATQVPIAATASTVTSSKAIQGTDTNLLSSGTVAGTGATLCTDASGGATTTGCTSGGVSSVTGTAPIASSGGSTPAISLQNSTPANITTVYGTQTSIATSGDPGATANVPMVSNGSHGVQASASGALATGAFAAAYVLPAPTASTLGGVESIDCTGTGHILKINTSGVPSCSADAGGVASLFGQTGAITALTVPTGDSLNPTGTGVVNANQVNGASVPASAGLLGSNSSSQLISAGSVPTFTGSGTAFNAITGCYYQIVPYTAFTAASPTMAISLFSTPGYWHALGFVVQETTTFTTSLGTITSLAATVQSNSAVNFTTPMYLMGATASGFTPYDGGFYSAASSEGASQTLQLLLSVANSSPGNLGTGSATNLTAGNLKVTACGLTLQ